MLYFNGAIEISTCPASVTPSGNGIVIVPTAFVNTLSWIVSTLTVDSVISSLSCMYTVLSPAPSDNVYGTSETLGPGHSTHPETDRSDDSDIR